MDEARALKHEFGLRPYRVFLIWQERDDNQRYQEFKRIELMPVKVALTSQFTRIEWMLSSGGSRPEGDIQLFEISPNQVSADDLRGRINGKDLPDGQQFFYEITRDPRCAGDPPESWRYALKSLPFLEAERFQWVVDLTDQSVPRDPDITKQDRDQVHLPAGKKRTEPSIRF